MYKRPIVLGIDPHVRKSKVSEGPRELLSAYGNNIGNMLFFEGAASALKGAKRCGTYNPTPEDIEGCDAVVIAAANWLNSYNDFGWLAWVVEHRLGKLPVFVLGMGAQADSSSSIPKLSDGTKQFVDVLKARGAVITTRGQYTSEVLSAYGVHDSVVTGCPSLLYREKNKPSFPASGLPNWRNSAVHSTRHLSVETKNALQTYFFRQALKHEADYIAQSELEELCFALNLSLPGNELATSQSMLERVYEAPFEKVFNYLSAHARAYLDLEEWIAALASKQFCFGTRLHGTVASLLAGTPAVLVTHDARTEEIAAPMGLPVISGSEIDRARDLDLEEIYAAWNADAFLQGYERYKQKYEDLFIQKGLEPSWLPQ